MEIEEHLEGCSHCAALFEEISQSGGIPLSKLRRHWPQPAANREAPSTSAEHATGNESDTDRFQSETPGNSDSAQAWPERIGQYRICGLLGSGAFGDVFHGKNELLEELEVAVKVARSTILGDQREQAIFLEEARALTTLKHPAIVPIHDVGVTDDGRCYIVTRLIRGKDLSILLRESGRLPTSAAARIVADVAEALHHAHKKGLVHRDVKPANILLDDDGSVFLSDFGLALKERDFGRGANWAGTPAYMSPEQARGEGALVDGRSDIFALGAVLYELLTGRRPFEGKDRDELLHRIQTVEPRPPRQIEDRIPKKLERICLKALAKSLPGRYTTAKDLASDLRQLAGDRRGWSRYGMLSAASSLLVAALLVVVWIRSRGTPDLSPHESSPDVASVGELDWPTSPGPVGAVSANRSNANGEAKAPAQSFDAIAIPTRKFPLEPVFSLSFDEPTLERIGGQAYVLSHPTGTRCAVSGARWSAEGKLGGAMQFDGESSIEFPDSGFPAGDDPRSVAFWLRTSDLARRKIPFHYGVAGHGPGAFDVAIFERRRSDRLGDRLTLSWPNDPPRSITSSETVVDGEWHHAAMVYDGNGEARLYVDGRLVGSGHRRFATQLTGLAQIGNYPAGNHGFVGWLDEFALYTRPLSDEEIQRLASGTMGVVLPGVHEWWTDLLPQLDAKVATGKGSWVKRSGRLFSETQSRIHLPVHPRDDYELEIEFVRLEGRDGLAGALPVADTWFSFGVGVSYGDNHNLHGKHHRPGTLENGCAYTLSFQVRADRGAQTAELRLFLDGRLLVENRIALVELGRGGAIPVSDVPALQSQNAKFEIRKIRARALPKAADKAASPGPD